MKCIVKNQDTNNNQFHPILFFTKIRKESECNAIRSKSETIKPRKFGFQLKLTPSPISLSLYNLFSTFIIFKQKPETKLSRTRVEVY